MYIVSGKIYENQSIKKHILMQLFINRLKKECYKYAGRLTGSSTKNRKKDNHSPFNNIEMSETMSHCIYGVLIKGNDVKQEFRDQGDFFSTDEKRNI